MSTALVDVSIVRFTVGRVSLPSSLLRSVTEVEVDQRLGRPSQLRVTFAGGALDEVETLISNDTEVVARVDGHGIDLFAGQITGIQRSWAIDGQERVTVRADDALDRLRQERRTAEFFDLSAIEIAAQVVQQHGLRIQSDHAAPSLTAVHQQAETDLGFLRRILNPIGLWPTLRGETVHLVPSDGIGRTLTLHPGTELHELSIDQRVTAAADVGVLGWNTADAAAIRVGDGNHVGGWMLDETLADQLSDSVSQRGRSDHVVATGVATGDTTLRPGTPLELRRSSQLGSRSALTDPDILMIVGCVHRLDAAIGYITEFSTEPIDPVPTPAPASLTLGVVVDLDDPEQRARVKVELAAFDDLVTDWMPVVCPGAGADVGIVALPDIGARVAVLGPADAFGHGVVLGGLFGGDEAPGPPIVDGRSRTYAARLPGGGQLVIADDESRVLIENGAGSRLEMSPEGVTLFSAVDLELAAPGQHLLIRADTIDFERA